MIKIICVGKIKEYFLKSAIDEYRKRISKYTRLEIIQVCDEGLVSKALPLEGDRILKNIKDNDFVVTLEIDGKVIDSLEFASLINKNFNSNGNLVFVIGGSYGLSNEVKRRSNYALSFSRMTFPHQLFRVILLEQLYRAFKINNNESYHK